MKKCYANYRPKSLRKPGLWEEIDVLTSLITYLLATLTEAEAVLLKKIPLRRGKLVLVYKCWIKLE